MKNFISCASRATKALNETESEVEQQKQAKALLI